MKLWLTLAPTADTIRALPALITRPFVNTAVQWIRYETDEIRMLSFTDELSR